MLSKKCIRSISIKPGCIGCRACAFYAPEIFIVEKKSTVKPNLSSETLCIQHDAIIQAVQHCPVKVIVVEEV
jgi:ferredoxin